MKPHCVSTNLLTMPRRIPLVALLAASLVAVVAPSTSHAQYKVIGADGKVTYTDRAPSPNEGKVTSLGTRILSTGASSDVLLPLELRQVVSRYPVTLYTVTGACEPCESARQLLRQRGVPFSEKQVQSPEDSEALERLSGGRDAPTLTIGSQTLRGLAPEVWSSYLDAAGYPRDSRLPATYQYPPATSITERREASTARAPAARASQPSAPEAPAAPPPPNPSGIKF
jgi:glutaredoxin